MGDEEDITEENEQIPLPQATFIEDVGKYLEGIQAAIVFYPPFNLFPIHFRPDFAVACRKISRRRDKGAKREPPAVQDCRAAVDDQKGKAYGKASRNSKGAGVCEAAAEEERW
jgi:hypothetical protein